MEPNSQSKTTNTNRYAYKTLKHSTNFLKVVYNNYNIKVKKKTHKILYNLNVIIQNFNIKVKRKIQNVTKVK